MTVTSTSCLPRVYLHLMLIKESFSVKQKKKKTHSEREIIICVCESHDTWRFRHNVVDANLLIKTTGTSLREHNIRGGHYRLDRVQNKSH